MIERDAFEARFAAAVLGYAGRVSSEVDPGELAHRIAARDPRRHRVWAAMALRGVAIPARVWVLLLLAALLTGLVAGALGAGWRAPELPGLLAPAGRLYACPAGSNPDAPGPADQARPIRSADGFGPLALAVVDSRSGRLVAVIDTGSRVETWTFDLCTNTWTQMLPNHGPPSFEWGQLVYDEDSDVTILSTDAGSLWAYDLPSDTWTSMGASRLPGPTGYLSLWGYDPLTGFVVVESSNDSGAWNYDVETNSWTVIPEANAPLAGGRAVYDASVDRIVFPDRWAALFDIRSGTWSSGTAEMPQVIAGYGMSSPDAVYDGAAERTVVIGNERIAAYDATTDRWEVVLDSPDLFVPLPIAYDPVNRRLIGLGRGGVVDFGGVAAFDMVTREWTVLLDAR